MRQIASTSIKCTVTERNKETIKRALSMELNKDVFQWTRNELEFNSCFNIYRVYVTIELLPDSRGYLIRACDEYKTESKSKTKSIGFIIMTIAGVFLLKFAKVFLKDWGLIVVLLFFAFIILIVAFIADVLHKMNMRMTFKKVSRVLKGNPFCC